MSPRIALCVLSLILSVLVGASLARGGGDGTPAANSARDSGKRLVLGLSLDTLKEERWQRDKANFEAACKTLGVDEVITLSANSDDTAQARDCRSLIAQKVDCLVIAAHDGKAMSTVVDEAAKAGIPVLAYDRLIMGTPNLHLYITFDNLKVGREQARFLVERLAERKPARIVRIFGSKADNNAHVFKRGQEEVLEPLVAAGKVVIVDEDWAADWKPDNAKKIAQAFLTKHGNAGFDAVLASNDGTAAGAIEALRDAGLLGKVLVTGQDAERAACQRIALGEQSMTIYKPLPALARQAAELAVRLARRQPVVARDSIDNGAGQVPSVFGPVTTVTIENLLETVVKDSFHSYDDIFANIPADRRPARP
jgi:D-xylose transport system substrate-binding protein